MAKIYFQDGEVTTLKLDSSRRSITKAILNHCGGTSVKNITDEIDYYDHDEDEQKFVDEHKDCDFFEVYESVGGAWEQPLDIVAVNECE